MKNFVIGKKIKKIIDDANIVGIGNKVFPLVATPDTKFPFIVYRRLNYQSASNKDYRGERIMVELVVASERYEEGLNIANSVADTLTAYTDELIEQIELYNVQEMFIQDTFLQNIQFQIELK